MPLPMKELILKLTCQKNLLLCFGAMEFIYKALLFVMLSCSFNLVAFENKVLLSPLMSNHNRFLQAYSRRSVNGFTVDKKPARLWAKSTIPVAKVAIPEVVAAPDPEPFHYYVRVLLEQQPDAEGDVWSCENPQGFYIIDADELQKRVEIKKSEIKISRKGKSWYAGGKKINANKFYLLPKKGYVNFNDDFYSGTCIFVAKDNNLLFINQVDIEDYVCSVLRFESWPGWPVEVNKSFAIAIRSYVVSKILESKRTDQLYHIKNSNVHQTYRGVHQNEVINQAVSETQGLILTYNKKPIIAMFDCCCGGVIPALVADINHKEAPYLSRSYECTFCKPCKIYSWKLEYTTADIVSLLAAGGHKLRNIRDISVIKKDAAGIVQKVRIKSLSKTIELSGKQMYSLMKKIKSHCYTIKQTGNKVIFAGKGYGHHMGICQWGARRMLDHGYTYKKILDFYYPGTVMKSLRNL